MESTTPTLHDSRDGRENNRLVRAFYHPTAVQPGGAGTKFDSRNPKEIRSTNARIVWAFFVATHAVSHRSRIAGCFEHLKFGFGISFGFRDSTFGFPARFAQDFSRKVLRLKSQKAARLERIFKIRIWRFLRISDFVLGISHHHKSARYCSARPNAKQPDSDGGTRLPGSAMDNSRGCGCGAWN
jgi:hypothetical protein